LVGSGHQSPGLWRHPDDHSHEFNNLEHWVELAKLLEDAKFHGIFIADVLGKTHIIETRLLKLKWFQADTMSTRGIWTLRSDQGRNGRLTNRFLWCLQWQQRQRALALE